MSKTTKEEAPREFLDYLDPKWKGKIVSTYPNDDDADVPGCDRTPKRGTRGDKLRQDKKKKKLGAFGSWGR